MRDLTDTLRARLAGLPPGPIVVAYSGGLDSSVLLHALANTPAVRKRGLRGVHVDHGLHADSSAWAEHCRMFAATVGVDIAIRRVRVAADGSGVEDAARRARFAALAEELRPGATLALAHHADDQAETILLKLLRGAGPEGLGAMRRLRPFADGYLWRPLLGVPRSGLMEYAQLHGIRWIDDPSNADTALSRNFLRAEIMPRLRRRWPDVQIALAHSATWARAAADYLDAEAQRALARIQGVDPATLRWQPWLDLPDALRHPVLRLWLRGLDLSEPAYAQVAELERQLHHAHADRAPCVTWAGAEIRRYRDLIHAMAPVTEPPADWQLDWDGRDVVLPDGGSLALRGRDSDLPAAAPPLQIRYRRGGEQLKPAGGAHRRDLRLLLQEAGVPPWLRRRIPLVYSAAELLAVGDLFLSDIGAALCERLGARIVWSPPRIEFGAPLL